MFWYYCMTPILNPITKCKFNSGCQVWLIFQHKWWNVGVIVGSLRAWYTTKVTTWQYSVVKPRNKAHSTVISLQLESNHEMDLSELQRTGGLIVLAVMLSINQCSSEFAHFYQQLGDISDMLQVTLELTESVVVADHFRSSLSVLQHIHTLL